MLNIQCSTSVQTVQVSDTTILNDGTIVGNKKLNHINRVLTTDMPFIDFTAIVEEAWKAYDNTREIIRIVDISAKVSTNHVYRVSFTDGNFIIAKMSYFGSFEQDRKSTG